MILLLSHDDHVNLMRAALDREPLHKILAILAAGIIVRQEKRILLVLDRCSSDGFFHPLLKVVLADNRMNQNISQRSKAAAV